jgi:hypothetical protein
MMEIRAMFMIKISMCFDTMWRKLVRHELVEVSEEFALLRGLGRHMLNKSTSLPIKLHAKVLIDGELDEDFVY